MTVKQIPTNIICLEYRQDREDSDYGSCLYARYYFNLDRYELTIISDCGSYGYKWVETPKSESFLELMARVHWDYLLNKFCGSPSIFDYDATKADLYDVHKDDEEATEKLNEIFDVIECEYYPETGSDFIRMFDEENDGYFCDTFEFPVYVHSSDAIRVCKIFDEHIRPKIKEMLYE